MNFVGVGGVGGGGRCSCCFGCDQFHFQDW